MLGRPRHCWPGVPMRRTVTALGARLLAALRRSAGGKVFSVSPRGPRGWRRASSWGGGAPRWPGNVRGAETVTSDGPPLLMESSGD
jgi:hypothetical protein